MVGGYANTRYLFLPVGVVAAQSIRNVAVHACVLGQERAVLVGVHHLKTLGDDIGTYIALVIELRLAACLAFLGGNNNDTIAGAATVDSRSRSVFQHREGLNIIRVNHRKRVRYALDTVVIHSQTVDDNQRVVACGQ